METLSLCTFYALHREQQKHEIESVLMIKKMQMKFSFETTVAYSGLFFPHGIQTLDNSNRSHDDKYFNFLF